MEFKPTAVLEIFIITYNRAVHLDNTLRQLYGCPFVTFSITILDNCSTDDTYEIFVKHKKEFPNLNYTKNKINLGADANVLRAAELSDGIYTWILCDDDYYDFTNCDDILLELKRAEAAAIMVGWSEPFVWPKGGMYDTPANLLSKGLPYFSIPTFVPGSIFKTDLFQKQIRASYSNIANLLPAMTYYISLYKTKEKVYVSNSKVVVAAGAATYDYTFIKVMLATLNTFYLIDSKHIRRIAFYQSYLNPPYMWIIKHVFMMQRSESPILFIDRYRYYKLLNWRGKCLYLMAYIVAPIAAKFSIPEPILKFLRKYRV